MAKLFNSGYKPFLGTCEVCHYNTIVHGVWIEPGTPMIICDECQEQVEMIGEEV
jgi:hypothetical protein